MKINFKIWRQDNSKAEGQFKNYEVQGLTEDMSLLEALDHLNEKLVENNELAVAFDHDCREGICGQCGIFINGRAHGPYASIVPSSAKKLLRTPLKVWALSLNLSASLFSMESRMGSNKSGHVS